MQKIVRRYPTMSDALIIECSELITRGADAAPRGEETRESLGAHIVIVDPVRHGLPVRVGRKVSTRLAAVEGAQLLAGAGFPDVAVAVAPSLARYADRGPDGAPFFHGGYADRVGPQLAAVERQLRDDPETRRAVASLWSESDRDPAWRDRPCTTELQWLARGGGLVAFTYMRANDAWKGFSYDVFQFGQLQALLAHVLGLRPAAVHHIAASFHLYEADVPRASGLRWETEDGFRPEPVPSAGPEWHALDGDGYSSVEECHDRFRGLLGSLRDRLAGGAGAFSPRNAVERWYLERLSSAEAFDGPTA